MGNVMIGTPNGQVPTYVAIPSGAGPWPGWWWCMTSRG